MLRFVHVPKRKVGHATTVSAGLMPTEARGNYLPEPPYLRETKTYHSQPLESIRHAGNYFVPLSIRPIFLVAEVMSNYLTTDGLKKIIYFRRPPLWPEARGICHICHVVNPALTTVHQHFAELARKVPLCVALDVVRQFIIRAVRGLAVRVASLKRVVSK